MKKAFMILMIGSCLLLTMGLKKCPVVAIPIPSFGADETSPKPTIPFSLNCSELASQVIQMAVEQETENTPRVLELYDIERMEIDQPSNKLLDCWAIASLAHGSNLRINFYQDMDEEGNQYIHLDRYHLDYFPGE